MTAEEKQPKVDTINFSPELLSMYYARVFPYEFLHKWLSYGETNNNTSSSLFSHREWSFTLELQGEEIYIRYQSFSNADELAAAVKKRNPRKIDIGAVFSYPPKDSKTVNPKAFKTEQRELVFDIDLTDYDSVRSCCTGANICQKCWSFMKMAIKCMDVGLKEDFGFQHVTWFYSGRRGVHAWVSDEEARMLSNEARSAVAQYFEIEVETDKNKDGAKLSSPLHPMLDRSFSTLEPYFIKYVIPASGQGLLANKDQWSKLLQSLPEPAKSIIVERMEKEWDNEETDDQLVQERWESLKRCIEVLIGKNKQQGKATKNMSSAERTRLEMWPTETVFKYTYPRLDINVSKMQNHLLKSPFCVHPKTGRICVPINAAEVDNFDPFKVPTLDQIMNELDAYDKNSVEKTSDIPEWKKTSLKESFSFFESTFLEPMLSESRKRIRDEAEKKAAIKGDF